MSIKVFSNRSNAARAAKKAMGGDATATVDFTIYPHGDGYTWAPGKGTGLAGAPSEPAAKSGKKGAKASKKAPKAKATKARKAAKPKGERKPRALGKRAQALADAQAGKMPAPPDFSAETHARYRGKLDELVKLAKAGDVKDLKAFEINPISTSPKALDRYRNLAVTALEAQARGAKAA